MDHSVRTSKPGKALRRHLSFANTMSVLAVFVALGGSAYAATQLKKNSVGTKQIKNGSVSSAKLKKGAVTSLKLADGAVGTAQLQAGAVGGAQVQGGSLTGTQVRDGSLTGAQIQDGSLTGADINQASLTAVRAANVIGILVKGDGSCSPQVPFPAGVSAEHGVSGVCNLNFPASVAECAATVSVGGSLLIAEERSAQTSREAKAPNQIHVITYQEAVRQDLPFDLILVC